MPSLIFAEDHWIDLEPLGKGEDVGPVSPLSPAPWEVVHEREHVVLRAITALALLIAAAWLLPGLAVDVAGAMGIDNPGAVPASFASNAVAF